MPLTASKIIRIDVDRERLKAIIAFNGDTPGPTMTADEILKEVTDEGIMVDDQGKKNIETFAAEFTPENLPKPVVVATGKEPVHDRSGRIEKLYLDKEPPKPSEPEAKESTGSENPKDPQAEEDEVENHYDRSSIIKVHDNEQILKIHPIIHGDNGVDVYGKEINRKLGVEAKPKLGLNVELQGDGVFATCGGQLFDDNDKFWVNPKLEIQGNVDFSVGNIDFDGEVIIGKNVVDLFKVVSKSEVSVHGMIEAAEVQAGKDLFVTGGVAGKEKGVVIAGRDIQSKYLTNAKVRAKRDIIAVKEVVNCDLACNGQLKIETGSLIGGNSMVMGGILVKQLGSELGVKTNVSVGIDADLKALYEDVLPKVREKKQKAKKVKQVVEPLLANQKHLNQEQKEKATELLYQAYELEDSVNEMLEDLETAYKKTQQEAVTEISVLGTVYNGVVIQFPKVNTMINSPIEGPLTIKPVKVKGSLRVIAVDKTTGSEHDLGAGAGGDDLFFKVEALLRSNEED